MTPTRYLTAADENILFQKGVVSWRLDVQTSKTLIQLSQDAIWGPIPPHKNTAPNICQNPVGTLTQQQQDSAKTAVKLALNDPILFPQLRQMGTLTPKAVELQNGAFDDGWHHDHLSNKRGHAGQFFFIAYVGKETTWDSQWGGGFHYGTRTLTGNWSQDVAAPEQSEVIWPTKRTALLGWNENPRLIHRAEFLKQEKDRTAFLMPIDLIPHS